MMRPRLALMACALLCLSPCTAQDAIPPATTPDITGFLVGPTSTNQCRPVRISVTLRNNTREPICSQQPYAGATYNVYQSFREWGFEPLPDRYTVGVSLSGGRDGYPYRWGFRGVLKAGGTTTVVGFLALVELGRYDLAATVLKSGAPLAGVTPQTASVLVEECPPTDMRGTPVPGRPIHPVINGVRYPPFTPYMLNGHALVALRPFIYPIAPNICAVGTSIIVRRPGLEVVLFPGTQKAVVNGVPVLLPVPIYTYGGVTYVPLRYVSPLFGATFYYYPDSGALFVHGPPPPPMRMPPLPLLGEPP